MIIDSHAHLLPPARMAKLIEWTLRFSPSHPVPPDVTLDALLREYTEAGVSYVWNFAHAIFPEETDGLNEWNFRLAQAQPQMVPIGTCHPKAPAPLAVIDRCLGDYRFIGMKFHPYVQRFVPWEERFFPLYERIAAHGRLVIFHTGFETFYGGPLPLAGFEAILRAVPGLTVVLAHANYPKIAAAFDLVARYPGVYLDTVHVFARVVDEWEPDGDRLLAWRQLREGLAAFPGRVMFGTDHPAGAGSLVQMYADVDAFGLAAGLREAVLGGTALGLMRRMGWTPR